ncbi:MAG: AraC family transcriptional regulator [Clostridia bacterium]|nr:AraC family transcriptional regulator [Clostridia bacterium]
MILYEHRTSMGLHRTHRLDCPPHLHRHIELIYVVEGTSKVQIDQTEYIVSAGQFAITFPLQIHGYSDSNNLDSFLVLCDPDEFNDLSETFATGRPINPIIDLNDPLMIELFKKAIAEYHGDSKYKNEFIKGCIQVILSKVLEQIETADHEPTDMNIVEKILEYCDNEYMNPISLDTLSKKVGASKYYISRIFSAKIKMSFNDYINTLRVNASKRFLKHTKDSIEIISAEVGFSTVRSYNREFKRLVGISPSQYRKNKSK